MAKGQKRSTKEIRKPKKEKTADKPQAAFGNQVKATLPPAGSRGSTKS